MSTDAFTIGDGCTYRLTKFEIASILSSRWRVAVVIVAALRWVKPKVLYRVRLSRVALYRWSFCATASSCTHVSLLFVLLPAALHCISCCDAEGMFSCKNLSCTTAYPFFQALRIQGGHYVRRGRPERIRPKVLMGRFISGFWDQRTYHFRAPLFPRESEKKFDDFSRSWLGRECPPGGSLVGRTICTPIL